MICNYCGYPINPFAANHPDCVAKRIEDLEAALRPFAEFACWVDESGWTSTIHREPISAWFGPSDFREAGKLKP